MLARVFIGHRMQTRREPGAEVGRCQLADRKCDDPAQPGQARQRRLAVRRAEDRERAPYRAAQPWDDEAAERSSSSPARGQAQSRLELAGARPGLLQRDRRTLCSRLFADALEGDALSRRAAADVSIL